MKYIITAIVIIYASVVVYWINFSGLTNTSKGFLFGSVFILWLILAIAWDVIESRIILKKNDTN